MIKFKLSSLNIHFFLIYCRGIWNNIMRLRSQVPTLEMETILASVEILLDCKCYFLKSMFDISLLNTISVTLPTSRT
ncbi:hypothetical protein GLYMA_17G079600v4 [Glycine max]|uniref:Uncharacterized protein n=2 Tax=Glycine subgen. Soja TaxID=1462606 RepID=K7MKI6_SOYBN|nr:hypothetical protein GYH30_046602 [Glycine max]KRH03147.1 hypothetical protein GLYMA_17G079600v4 [Glycine max]RZB55830.1 hypothetical protein D0Y65_045207 [Glycine soja]